LARRIIVFQQESTAPFSNVSAVDSPVLFGTPNRPPRRFGVFLSRFRRRSLFFLDFFPFRPKLFLRRTRRFVIVAEPGAASRSRPLICAFPQFVFDAGAFMNTFQRDLDAAAERARRFFADARSADRRPGELATAALSLSETLVSLAFRSDRALPTVENETPAQPRLAVFSPKTSDEEPTILRLDAFRRRVQPEPKRTPPLKIFNGSEPERAPAFPRLFVPNAERPRLRVVAAD
jgi:hypothetical protein